MCDVDLKWPSSFPGLKAVDQHLRCGICYEYLKTAMITSCSHNYCSVCIRKSLQYRTQCPSCFEETVETHLRNNRVLDELVRIFTELRDDLILCLRVSEYKQSVAQKTGDCGLGKSSVVLTTPLKEPISCSTPHDHSESVSSPVIQLRCRITNFQKAASKNLNTEFDKRAGNFVLDRVPQPSTSSAVEIVAPSDDSSCMKEEIIVKKDVLIPSIFSPKKPGKPKVPENKVACPVCTVEISEVHINQHLDACLKTPKKQKKVVKRVPLPKLVYNLMKEKQLRQKLKEAGLSTQGDYKMLVQRHSRFTLLYNAECDTLDPRPVSEIIQQVEREEKEEKENQASNKISGTLKLLVDKKSDPKTIEEARTKYLQENKNSFNRLIQSLKQREAKTLLPSSAEDEVQSETSSDTGEITTRKHFVTKSPICDTNPDSPDDLETVVLSDDDSIFNQKTLGYSVEDADIAEVTCAEGSAQTASVPVMNEAAVDVECASNKSFSLLEDFDTDSLLESRMAENGVSTKTWNVDSDDEDVNYSSRNSISVGRRMRTKVLDSQLEDPNYRPDTQDVLDSESSNEGQSTRKPRNSRLRPLDNSVVVKELVELRKGCKKLTAKGHSGTVLSRTTTSTHLKSNFDGKKFVMNGRQGHSGVLDVSDNGSDFHNSSEETISNSLSTTRRKRKVSFDECSGNKQNSEEFVLGCKNERVKIKFSSGQQSQKRILRQRTKR